MYNWRLIILLYYTFCGYVVWMCAVVRRCCCCCCRRQFVFFGIILLLLFACAPEIHTYTQCLLFTLHGSDLFIRKTEICSGCLCFCVKCIWLPAITWEYRFVCALILSIFVFLSYGVFVSAPLFIFFSSVSCVFSLPLFNFFLFSCL